MKYFQKILIIIFVCISFYSVSAQTNSKTITLEGNQINLEEIDLEKGLIINNSIIGYESGEGFENSPTELTKTIYRSPACKTYVVAEEKAGYEWCSGIYTYFNFEGDTLFSKEFEGSCGSPLITQNGDFVIIDLYDGITNLLIIMDKRGEIIKEFQDWETSLITGDLQCTIVVKLTDDNQSLVNFIFLDEGSKTTREIGFHKFMTVQSHSRNEKYFVLTDGDTSIVYNNLGEVQWQISRKQETTMLLFNNGERYLYFYKDSLTNKHIASLVEVKSQKTLAEFKEIVLADNTYPVYAGGFVDDNCSAFYLFTYKNDSRIFNFYNADGIYINAGEIPSYIREFSFKLEGGKYGIIIE